MKQKQKKRLVLSALLIICLCVGGGLFLGQQKEKESNGTDVLRYAQVGDEYLQVYRDERFENILVKGVNLGVTTPGGFPRDGNITKQQYNRWLEQIGEMNANVIRIYTPHPPAFYEALQAYNETAKQPLYIFQGVWVDDSLLEEKKNMLDEEIVDSFQTSIKEAVDIVHGNYQNNYLFRGEAYEADVSTYVLGYVVGIEWPEEVVRETNEQNRQVEEYKGMYVETKKARPFEVSIAQQLDDLVHYEAEQYKMIHPVSFINWVPTDPFSHKGEKDTASIKDMAIVATEKFPAGIFTTFHVYPYYPDFLNVEKKYVNYRNKAGKKDNFAGYVHELKKEIKRPIVIGEFGVPSSRGRAHENVHSMHQGKLSEEKQGEINAQMYQDIVSEQLAGGVLFAWQDEWFKHTWNTRKVDDPDRRPFWSNVQSSEEHYGLLTFEPQKNGKQFRPDWKDSSVVTIADTPGAFLQTVHMTSDARYLYVQLAYTDDFDAKETTLFIQTTKKSGNTKWEQLTFSTGIDFVLTIKNEQSMQLFVDEYYDPFTYRYGVEKQYFPLSSLPKKNSGTFVPLQEALTEPNRALNLDFEYAETGRLQVQQEEKRNGHPDILTDVIISKNRKTVEIRLPWSLLNVADPSQKVVLGDLYKEGLESREKIDGIQVAYAITKKNRMIETYPEMKNNQINLAESTPFTWKTWNKVRYTERLKPSYDKMKEIFQDAEIKE